MIKCSTNIHQNESEAIGNNQFKLKNKTNNVLKLFEYANEC